MYGSGHVFVQNKEGGRADFGRLSRSGRLSFGILLESLFEEKETVEEGFKVIKVEPKKVVTGIPKTESEVRTLLSVKDPKLARVPLYIRYSEFEYPVFSVFEEVAYWRKANAIHGWFVDNVQNGVDNCGYYEVTKEKLEELLLLTRAVLDYPKLAPKILPTREGFFFGSTEYDEYYFEDLRHTEKVLKKVLEETNWEREMVVYHSSW